MDSRAEPRSAQGKQQRAAGVKPASPSLLAGAPGGARRGVEVGLSRSGRGQRGRGRGRGAGPVGIGALAVRV